MNNYTVSRKTFNCFSFSTSNINLTHLLRWPRRYWTVSTNTRKMTKLLTMGSCFEQISSFKRVVNLLRVEVLHYLRGRVPKVYELISSLAAQDLVARATLTPLFDAHTPAMRHLHCRAEGPSLRRTNWICTAIPRRGVDIHVSNGDIMLYDSLYRLLWASNRYIIRISFPAH